jgi:hypothetical protein
LRSARLPLRRLTSGKHPDGTTGNEQIESGPKPQPESPFYKRMLYIFYCICAGFL